MTARTRSRLGLGIVELLVSLAVVAALMSVTIPVLAGLGCDDLEFRSAGNLVRLGQAHAAYAADWNDRQFTVVRDDLGVYGGDCEVYGEEVGCHPPLILGDDCDGITLGFYFGCGPGAGACSGFDIVRPINFTGPLEARGSFRLVNARGFHEYVNGRFYDPVFYAPKDGAVIEHVQPLFGLDCEYAGEIGEDPLPSSYALSPAAMYHPDVLAPPDEGGFFHPDAFDDGYASPTVSQALYPDLKTRMIEHNWLQNVPGACNPDFGEPCEPYYFNMGYRSFPRTLFFDGHVSRLSVREAMANGERQKHLVGHGLWSLDTPWGNDGYFISRSWDFLSETSYHILTTGGILGRDTLGF